MLVDTKSITSWILRGLAALIMLQSLIFKFTAAPESVYIFSKLHMEPWGRIVVGIMELIASALIIIPRTTWVGALLGLGIMSGAIFFHLTSLGIEVQGDDGELFIYALLVFLSCAALLFQNKVKMLSFLSSKRSEAENHVQTP